MIQSMTTTVAEQGRPRRTKGLLEYGVSGELVLLDSTAQRVYALNPTAAGLWLLCDGRHTETELAAALASLFNQPVSRVEADVSEMLGQFRDAGLIEDNPRLR